MRTPGAAGLPVEENRDPGGAVDEPGEFARRTVVLAPGESRPSHDAEWAGALVLLVRGEVELECAAGGRRRFRAGAVLWLSGIDIRVLHGVGVEPVVILAVTRAAHPG